MAEVLVRLRRTPPREVPSKLQRWATRGMRARLRRRAMQRARGELSDRAFLRALGGRFASTQQALAHFRTRATPHFFVNGQSAPAIAAALQAAFPDVANRTRAAAQQALDHTVDLLGSGPTSLGPSINWLADFKTGMEWPPAFYEDIDYLMLDSSCDVKVPWELSRCYHWVTLGRAYALDGDPRYALEFVAQMESWLDQNRWPYSVNWGRAMEVALRAVNWIWAAALFSGAPEVTEAVSLRLLKSLLQHGRHIADNLEFAGNNGNHYLSNGVGLTFLGTCFPEFAESAAWRAKGREIMLGELARQVYADGVDFEKGIGYQGLVLEFWYSALLLMHINGDDVPEWALEKLERMFDFMQAYTRPDGTFPQVGDNDDGRLAGLDDEAVGSHRRHLAVGAAMFGRGDLLAASGDAVQTALWLTGTDVLYAPRTPREPGSQAFPEGGFYVMRADDAVMLIDAGEVGMRGIGDHGHNDMLSYDLWGGGAPLLVDAGTYVYTADPERRELLRSTASHNTVRVDGEEMARLGGVQWLWRIEDDAHPTVEQWESGPGQDRLVVSHDGYARLSQPIVHRRTVVLDRPGREWRIKDELLGTGEHLVESFLHVATSETLAEVAGNAARLTAPRADLLVTPLSLPAGVSLKQGVGWVSRAYGHVERAPVLAYSGRVTAPATIEYALRLVPCGTPFSGADGMAPGREPTMDIPPERGLGEPS